MATPLHPIGLTMHASYALLFTPSGQQGPAAGWFVFQLAAVFAIIYFMILRPQKKQREPHNLLHAAKGVGLAANQVGVARRVAVVDVGEEFPPPLVLVNPRIVKLSDAVETAEEGCLSIPDIYGDVERPLAVTVAALDRDGQPYSV